MLGNLYGNPHSSSASSLYTGQCVQQIRLRLLELFKADPAAFDIVFVANTTAGIKLVMEAFRDHERGFWYGYHGDSHTSLIGVREVATEHHCFMSDSEVDEWIEEVDVEITRTKLFAYPAQSNMNGRRLPLDWSRRLRTKQCHSTYTLLDAAAFVTTSALDLTDSEAAPDFTVFSLYKMFGFPDLGALIVRRQAASALEKRRYFGGGTVEAVVVSPNEPWHATKSSALHEKLEDGTLPVHSIIALDIAMSVHADLYHSFDRISSHTNALATRLYHQLKALTHWNGVHVCYFYNHQNTAYSDPRSQGPVVTFNVRDDLDNWIDCKEVERLASIKGFHIRTGTLCNPGGVASALHLAPTDVRQNYMNGQRCNSETDTKEGTTTGVIRVSLGAMSAVKDVDSFVIFIEEFFVHQTSRVNTIASSTSDNVAAVVPVLKSFFVEALFVYPIKSCAGFSVAPGDPWEIRPEGLLWDREFLVPSIGDNVDRCRRMVSRQQSYWTYYEPEKVS